VNAELSGYVTRLEAIDRQIEAKQQEVREALADFAAHHPLSAYRGKDGRRLPNPLCRFIGKIEMSLDGCWNWVGTKIELGYGHFSIFGGPKLAHRWFYQISRGEIPKSLVCDHLCRNPSCVNPFHLEAVAQSVNVLRGDSGKVTGALQKAKTHCPYGHPYSGDNLYVFGKGYRACRQCADRRRTTYIMKRKAK
jgi:hypothetical protein